MLEFLQKPFTDYTDPGLYAIYFYIILITIELFISTKQKMELYERKDSWANISMSLVTFFTATVGKAFAYYILTIVYQHRIIDMPVVWWAWIILLFADDFTFYWYHRCHHEVRIFWATHIVHHSSQLLNFSTPFRQPWTVALYYVVFWIWLPFVGFQPWMILSMMSINLIYQFWTHTTLIGKLGFLELFMNTPSHHRVHHASNIHYLDKNHGGIFIIWDRLFGTFQEEDEKPVYGITNNINTHNLLSINFQEYISVWNDARKARSFSNVIKFIFYPPGWSPDGRSKTAKQLQKEIPYNHPSVL
jgi:sterol desaturase/sphingolipid hydroxylase (fatty acid hydroxylase superfamily)